MRARHETDGEKRDAVESSREPEDADGVSEAGEVHLDPESRRVYLHHARNDDAGGDERISLDVLCEERQRDELRLLEHAKQHRQRKEDRPDKPVESVPIS